MSRVVVQTFAFTNNPSDWACLRETGKKFNVDLRVMGEGRAYPPPSQGFRELARLIHSYSEPYVVLTDGYDTFFSRWDENEVADLCEAAHGGILCATEDWCWPPGPHCAVYTGPHKSYWFAINGGGMAGRREAVANLCDVIADRVDECQHGNQELLHKLLGEGYPMDRDQECRIWQCLHGRHSHLLEVYAEKAYNGSTGSWPMIVHANGTVPGLRKWWDACVGTPWPRTPGLKPE